MAKQKIQLIALAFFIVFILTDCQTKNGPLLKATARPTTAAYLRKIPTQPFSTSTPDTTLGQTGLSSGFLEFPGGVFEMTVPIGWNEELNEYGSVFLSEQSGEGAIYITVTNTVLALENEGFDQFLGAREENFFSGFDAYQEVERVINEGHDYGFVKKTVLFNEIPETVKTYYFRNQNAIYVMDFWMEIEKEEIYEEIYQPVLDSFKMNPEKVNELIPYNFIFEFRDNTDSFSFEVPISWLYQSTTSGGLITDNFYSPDNRSILQHVIFYPDDVSDPNVITKTIYQASQSVLSGPPFEGVLETRTVNDDGSVYLKWKTEKGDWQIESIFYIQAAKVLALTGIVQEEFIDIYQSSIDYGLDWYAVPAAE